MSELDPLDSRLGRAWQALSASDELQARVLTRLSSAGALGVASRSGPVASRWHALRASGALGAGVGAGLLGIGVALGYLIASAPPETPRAPERPSLAAAPRTESPAAAASQALESAPRAQPTSQRDAPRPPHTTLPESPREPEDEPLHEVSSGMGQPAARPPAPPSRAKPRPPVRSRAHGVGARPASPVDSGAELALLERAERAVRARHPALALALIEELEQRHPRSTLQEERRSIELMAHCQAQGPGAPTTQRIESFARQYPESAYSARIAAECGAASSRVPLTNGEAPDIDGIEGGNDVQNH